MAKQEQFMIKQVFGATDLELEAKSGESLLVKDIYIFNPVTNNITVRVEKTTVGYFRVGGNLGNHLPLPMGSPKHSHGVTVAAADGALTEDHALSNAYGISNANLALVSDLSALTTVDNMVGFGSIPAIAHETLLGYLGRKGIFNGYPIGEGETLLISGANQSGSMQIVIYEKYDAGDITPEQDNGSKSGKYFFVNYGRNAANITTSTNTLYSSMFNPAEFPDFPYGDVVPAKFAITIHGVLASDIVDDRGSNDTMNSTYLKLIKERETLFDDDKNGLFLRGIIGNTNAAAIIGRGLSLIGNYSDVDIKPPLMFPEAITFNDGEELNIFLSTIAGGSQSASDLLVADTEIGLIETVERVG